MFVRREERGRGREELFEGGREGDGHFVEEVFFCIFFCRTRQEEILIVVDFFAGVF